MRRLPALLVILAACLLAAAAPPQEPRLSARLSTPLVKLGGQVTLVVTLRDARDARLAPLPRVDGLELEAPQRPVENYMQSILNGRRFEQSSLEWAIRVRPTQAGEFEIPPIHVQVDGQDLSAPDEALTLRVIADVAGAERGFLTFQDLPQHVYEGQPFDLDLRFGWDQDLALAEARLYLPWWDQLRGVLEVELPRAAGGGAEGEVFINDRKRVRVQEEAPVVREGRVMRQYSLRRRFLATRPDDLELGSGTFQFAELLERGIGFRPDKVQRFYAQLPGATIDVRPIPEIGRPLEWTGAVGSLLAGRRVDRRDVDAGEPIRLTAYWYGDGNLEFFEPPDLSRLPAFSGFRILGVDDEKLGDERRVTYEVVPASEDETEIPPIPLWVFDPKEERFVQIETESVPIRVRAVADDLVGFGGAVEPDGMDLHDIQATPVRASGLPLLGGRLLGTTFGGLLLGWLALRTWVRRRGAPDAPAARRRRAARRVLSRDLARAATASAQSAALARFLAARTGEPDPAWIGRDPSEWLADQARAVEGGAALEQLAALSAELDEEAWARGDSALDRARIEQVADALAKGGVV